MAEDKTKSEQLPPYSEVAERAVLGAILLEASTIADLGHLKAESFYKTGHQAIFRACQTLWRGEGNVDLVLLHEHLKARNEIDLAGGVGYIAQLLDECPTAAAAPQYAEIIRQRWRDRRVIAACGEARSCLMQGYNQEEAISKLQSEIGKADHGSGDRTASIKDLVEQRYEQLEDPKRQPRANFVPTGIPGLDNILTGFCKTDLIILAGRPSMGKAQPLDSKVLTPQGWKNLGSLRVGQQISSIDGAPSFVSGVFPKGKRQVYRIEFSDGRSTECCAEHLWKVNYREWSEPKIMDTKTLIEKLKSKRYQRRIWIDTFCGEFGDNAMFSIDPWLVGALIGDGSIIEGAVRFSNADQEVLSRVERSIGNSMRLVNADGVNYRIIRKGGANRIGVSGVLKNPMKEWLKDLNLWGCRANVKRIPRVYMEADSVHRWQLLSGLIDTDGYVQPQGSIIFTTVSPGLADDVVELVRSLGGIASCGVKKTKYKYKGEIRYGQDAYNCYISHGEFIDKLDVIPRKSSRLKSRERERRLTIRSIEPSRIARTACISVTHDSRLYITDDYIVTHNTAFALQCVIEVARNTTHGGPVGFGSVEMSNVALTNRMLAYSSGIEHKLIREERIGPAEIVRIQDATAELYELPILSDDDTAMTPAAFWALGRRVLRKFGKLSMLAVDYLQLMYPDYRSKDQKRHEVVGDISRALKGMAKALNVPVLALCQLSRKIEDRAGAWSRPRLADLRESGSIEQDADVVLFLWSREDDPKKEVIEVTVSVGKQRNGPIGDVVVMFDKRRQKFFPKEEHYEINRADLD